MNRRDRLAALEAHLRTIEGLDPRQVSLMVIELYEKHGDDVLNLPPPAEVAADVELLAIWLAYADALVRTDPAKQFGDDPLLLPAASALKVVKDE